MELKDKFLTSTKGQDMEELLRLYFMQHGYYVLRGVKLEFNEKAVTDVDLWLYSKSSVVSRERINVDIKNKKRAQVIERVFWTIGIQKVYGFDKCIVATTDNRVDIKELIKGHNIILLDGNFLQKLQKNQNLLTVLSTRFSEDEFLMLFDLDGMGKFVGGWKNKIEKAKSRLIETPTFSSITETLVDVHFFLSEILRNVQYLEVATRGFFYIISTLLIQLDFVLKELIFLDDKQRYTILKDGFKYGDNGLKLIKQLFTVINGPIETELNISGSAIAGWLDKELDSPNNEIFVEYFCNVRNAGHLFDQSKLFLDISMTKVFFDFQNLDKNMDVLFVILDYFGVNRKHFFDFYINHPK
jgi:hypothetical protein